MFAPSARAALVLALGVASPAWACPALTTLGCGAAVQFTDVYYDLSDYDGTHCALSGTYPGGDVTAEITGIPSGRVVYVDLWYDAPCLFCDPTDEWDDADVDLFVYGADNCSNGMLSQSCGGRTSRSVGTFEEHVTFTSDGSDYQVVADEFHGFYGDYLAYDVRIAVSCPLACDPAVATPISCSTDFTDQPVGATDALDYFACAGTEGPFTHLQQPQNETIYAFTPQATGTVTFRLTGMTHDFDIYVLQSLCDQAACIESSTKASVLEDLVEFDAVIGTTYYIVIEAYDADAVAEGGSYDLSFDAGSAGGCKEDCDNSADDDGDGKIDCLDPDCCVDAVCADVSPLCCPDGDGDGYFPERCVGGSDCDDRPTAGATAHPGAAEVCNGRDDDCDGKTDESTPCFDDDGDGWTENAGDCDDADPSERPGATETCDGSDDDCDGVIDDGTSCYDDDGDCACEAAPCAGSVRPSCPSLTGGDCRDGDIDVGPAASEVPDNGVDDDCDGSVDGGIADPDGDGVTAVAGDCDDLDATAYPGATEAPDGADDDCDGTVDEGTTAFDDDGDGFCEGAQLDADADLECSDGSVPGDCGDFDVAIGPASFEIDGNGIDDDCDGLVDEGGDASDDDGDGLAEAEGDCDDLDADVHPGAEEVANDADDDCDGEVDEGFRDVDGDGVTVEEGDCDDEDGWVRPGLLDVCDGLDNDCDGTSDEDCEEERTAPPSDVGGCGCATGGASGWPALLGLLALRRRRVAAAVLLAGCANETDVSPLAAELSVASDLIDLGDVAVGAEVAFAVEIVHERGTGAAVEAVDVFNMEGDAFAAGSDLPEVPVGGTASVGLVYAPTEAGWHQAVVTVMTDADLSRELVVIVRGHAVNTSVSLWPRLVDFGPVAPGAIATGTITLSNAGLVDVAVVSSSLGHPRFDVVTLLPVTVPAGGTASIEVAFAPSSTASATDALSLALDHAAVPIVELYGNACEVGLPALYDVDLDGWTSCGGDCDDADATVNPGSVETVDGDDEDCDGAIDEGTAAWDDDGDCACEAPPCVGSSATCTPSNEPDCADADAAIGPSATEDPDNGIDDDCDGVVDQGTTDLDGDGYAPDGGDCDDTSATRYPGAPELPNGIDDDCDVTKDEGTVKYDDDGDGRCEQAPCTVGALGGGDCDDRPTLGLTAYPGATETANGRDDDCDGKVDEGTNVADDDGDGFSEQAGDCNDANPAVYPGTPGCAT